MGRKKKRVKVKRNLQRRDPATGHPYTILRWIDDQGQEQREPLGFVSRAMGDAAATLKLRELEGGPAAPRLGTCPSLRRATAEYLAVMERRRGAGDAYAQHEVSLSLALAAHAGKRVDAITVELVEDLAYEWHREGLKRYSIRNRVGTLYRVLAYAHRSGWIDRVPARPDLSGIAPDSRPPRRLDESEVSAIVGAAATEDEGLGDLVQVLAWSGRRPVAVFALEREHCDRVHDEGGQAYWVRDKGGRGRGWGPCTAAAGRAIGRRVAASVGGPLWTRPQGGRWTSKNICPTWRRWVKRAGLYTSDERSPQLYDLRRFGITRILRALNGDIRTAMQFTGHRKVETLLRYAYADDEMAALTAPSIDWTPDLTLTRGAKHG